MTFLFVYDAWLTRAVCTLVLFVALTLALPSGDGKDRLGGPFRYKSLPAQVHSPSAEHDFLSHFDSRNHHQPASFAVSSSYHPHSPDSPWPELSLQQPIHDAVWNPNHLEHQPAQPYQESLEYQHRVSLVRQLFQKNSGRTIWKPYAAVSEPNDRSAGSDVLPSAAESISIDVSPPAQMTQASQSGASSSKPRRRHRTTNPRSSSPADWTPKEIEAWKAHRDRRYFVEPKVLELLPYTSPRISKRPGAKVKFVETGDDIRKTINEEIFDGKLKWFDSTTLKETVRRSQRKMAERLTRELFSIEVPGPEGPAGRMRKVRILTHGGQITNDKWRKGHWLEGKTYWSFWSMPAQDSPYRSPVVIQKHGTGLLDPDDMKHVDRFLRGKFADYLRGFRQAP